MSAFDVHVFPLTASVLFFNNRPSLKFFLIYLHNIRNAGLILMKCKFPLIHIHIWMVGCSSVKQFVEHWIGSKLLSQP